jgi:hypothetical protein
MARQTWKAYKFASSQFAAILFHFLIHLKFVECSGINRGIKMPPFCFGILDCSHWFQLFWGYSNDDTNIWFRAMLS